MSRIYLVLDKKGAVVRYVRANTLNAAVRAHATVFWDCWMKWQTTTSLRSQTKRQKT